MRTASGIAQSARYADDNAIIYQGFSLLTANQHVLVNPKVAAIAANHRTSPPQIVFRFAQQIGMLPITGMSDPKHMRQDLDIVGIELHGEELSRRPLTEAAARWHLVA